MKRDLLTIPDPVFDEWDDDLMHDLLGNQRMGQAAQDVLLALLQIEMGERMGSLDLQAAFAGLRKSAEKFREALKDEFRETL